MQCNLTGASSKHLASGVATLLLQQANSRSSVSVRTYCTTGVCLLCLVPRPRCIVVVLLSLAAFLGSLILPVPAALARKTRWRVPVPDRDSAEVTAVNMRLLLPLLALDGSVESGDGLAASVDLPVVSSPGRVTENSSPPESMSLLGSL